MFINKTCAQKFEATFAESHRLYVTQYRKQFPDSAAACLETLGGCAAYAGKDNILSQAIGMGFEQTATDAMLDKLEHFYAEFDMGVALELSPLADELLFAMLAARGYRPVEFSNILHLPLSPALDLNEKEDGLALREARDSAHWAKLSSRGFIEQGTIPDSFLNCFKVFAEIPKVTCFEALIEGESAGGGAVGIYGDMCDLGFTSTLQKYRGLGVQKALVKARLKYARERQCRVALSVTTPGSLSQHNLEKLGFRVAYTRIKFNSLTTH